MTPRRNALGQPIGAPLPDWKPRDAPLRARMEGRYCALEPADPDRHAAQLDDAARADPDGRMWTYLPYGPFTEPSAYRRWMETTCLGDDPLFFSVVDAGGRAVGMASYLRVDPAVGSVEVGHVQFTPALQRTRAATEAMYLMMRHVLGELGYRRYEWKCDALNAPSRRAAERLGFRFEGVFRQATLYKGRSRDTAWFSVLDSEWPALEERFTRWLDPANFDAAGRQRTRLRG
ncbi:MAG: GNAT family N-acetyltransferase [Myxococcota bacterium]